ncbi:sialate O-acetylesterase [Paenibacillus sp. LjRoot56]|uniref:sialate O-acetylesterase n=1 Tax=Paenibacillus sp. LjRoot56 TaxID=3342333 RepID=UPI003ECE7785
MVRLTLNQTVLSVPKLFSDRMVIQQGEPVTVWGKAAAGARVTVRISRQVKQSVVTPEGEWLLQLDPLPYGGPHTMQITSDGHMITLSDIYVGEVWVCGGQSNMQWSLARTTNYEVERQAANYPGIRFFNVPITSSDRLEDDFKSGAWSEISPDTAGEATAVGYYFAKLIHETLKVPVGFIHASVGGTEASSWIKRETLESNPELAYLIRRYKKEAVANIDLQEQYNERERLYKQFAEMAAQFEQEMLPSNEMIGAPLMGPAHPRRPGALYNGMIFPIQPYTIKGVLWYQGESDAGRTHLYPELLRALIKEWRSGFRKADLTFLVVQLPGFGHGENWPLLREAQHIVVKETKDTGMVVTLDVGEWGDGHPPNKQPVGERLALLAKATVYGEDIIYEGPTCTSAVSSGDGKVKLSYNGRNSPKTLTGVVKGFEICGEDGDYYKAGAIIINESQIVAFSPRVAEPVGVRYAWAAYPDANVTNRERLPAYPFRMDVTR